MRGKFPQAALQNSQFLRRFSGEAVQPGGCSIRRRSQGDGNPAPVDMDRGARAAPEECRPRRALFLHICTPDVPDLCPSGNPVLTQRQEAAERVEKLAEQHSDQIAFDAVERNRIKDEKQAQHEAGHIQEEGISCLP